MAPDNYATYTTATYSGATVVQRGGLKKEKEKLKVAVGTGERPLWRTALIKPIMGQTAKAICG